MHAAFVVDRHRAARALAWTGPLRHALLAAVLALGGSMAAVAADEPLYGYEMGPALPADALDELAPLLPEGAEVHSAQVKSATRSQVLARVKLAQSGADRVLLDWQAQVDDPFLTLLPPLAETAALAPVIRRHVPDDAVLLAWWDVSRQLRLLAEVRVAFEQPLGLPLFVPRRWQDEADAVRAIEQAFWQPAGQAQETEQATFERFVDALLAPEQEGVAALRALGEGQPVVLVLHVRDLILLGQMQPQKLGVAFRDFGTPTEVHGMIQRVRAWLRENDYPAYGLLHSSSDVVRAVALTDAASSQTLAARLLPLIGNDQSDVASTRLVYRSGGYIVFEIAPQVTASHDSTHE